MKRTISIREIRKEWKAKRLVTVEFASTNGFGGVSLPKTGDAVARAIVRDVLKVTTGNEKVDTIFGHVTPVALYSFDTLKEAQDFIDGK